MAVTKSTMSDLGTPAPAFDLPVANPTVDDVEGDRRKLTDYDDAEALVVAFICNHCPYVKHIEDELIELARQYREKGVQIVGICSNNAETHPQDSFENMVKRAEEKDYSFPYLRDESQEVAKEYGAVCTPDFFVYGPRRKLVYRGRFDDSRPNQGVPTGRDLKTALDQLLEEGEVHHVQKPSMGCNIKWKKSQKTS